MCRLLGFPLPPGEVGGGLSREKKKTVDPVGPQGGRKDWLRSLSLLPGTGYPVGGRQDPRPAGPLALLEAGGRDRGGAGVTAGREKARPLFGYRGYRICRINTKSTNKAHPQSNIEPFGRLSSAGLRRL